MGQVTWAGPARCSYGAAGIAIGDSPYRRPCFSKRPYVFAWRQPNSMSEHTGGARPATFANAQLKALGLGTNVNSIGGFAITRAGAAPAWAREANILRWRKRGFSMPTVANDHSWWAREIAPGVVLGKWR